jgi:glyoxylase-like metal-dependent hydrolase (beta-lactamase superfamily II)
VEVVRHVHQLRAFGAQAFALLGERVTLIDTGGPGSGRAILRQLRALGRRPDEIERIVLTHYHIDHRGAAAELQAVTGARVLIHAAEAPYARGGLAYPNPVQTRRRATLLDPFHLAMRGRPLRVEELEDGQTIDVLGGLRVVHAPGHTRGSVALELPEQRLLLSGDTMGFRWGILETPDPVVSEDVEEAKASIERLATLDVDTIAFSHFQPLRRGAQRAIERLVETWKPREEPEARAEEG